MEQIKKRRNSILKKPPANEDDTTGDITTKIKRRISFSGKKSVKEFIAGEEEATIWGTSYEESAECLQANSNESGLVDVNTKRIVLRNRRVVVDPSTVKAGAKRRSKKKIHIAENDKENVYHHEPSVDPTVKVDSSVATEETKPTERVSIWSSTFDFINCSTAISQAIAIENSVDVTLNENEMQMLKFRVPVSARDVSPNLSLNSLRDELSPNIFSQSILMSEEDVKMLKMMRGKKAVEDEDMEPTLQDQQSMNFSPMEAHDSKRKTITNTVDIDVTKCEVDVKNLKRKTITKAVDMEGVNLRMDTTLMAHKNAVDSSLMDINSPLRKKPMHDATSKPMDITIAQSSCESDASRRQTIHFDSAAVDESLLYKPAEQNYENPAKDLPKPSRLTIHFKENRMVEETICQIADSSCAEMELSAHEAIDANPARNKHIATEKEQTDFTLIKSKRRQSIHTPDDIVEDSPKASKSTQAIHQQTIRIQSDMVEDSPKATKSIKSIAGRQTVYASADLVAENVHQRKSIYVPTDILEDSPKVTQLQKPKSGATTSKVRQSIYTPADIIEDSLKPTRAKDDNYTLNDIIQESPVQPAISTTNSRKRESIYNPTDIIEDSPTALDIEEDSSSLMNAISAAKPRVLQRQSIYTTSDMIEDSPKKLFVLHHQSIHAPTDIDVDSPLAQQAKVNQRKSIRTPVDIHEDSLKAVKTDDQSFKSFYGTSDMDKDSPKSTGISQRQSIYTVTDMFEDSPKPSSKSLSDEDLPSSQAAVPPPKVIVRHMNLQQGLSADQAALRILKNKQGQMKPDFETKKDDSLMDMSIIDEQTITTNKINFLQLNEQLFKGDAEIPQKERKESLFDRLERKPAEELNFDVFMDKPTTIGCVIPPPQNSMKDYTMELSMGKTLNNARGTESEYTMDLTLGKTVKPSGHRTTIDRKEMSPSNESSKRQTIHFSKDIPLDESTFPAPKETAQSVRQTIHVDPVPLEEDSMDLSMADMSQYPHSKSKGQTIHCPEDLEVETVITQKKRQTIHFNQDNELQQSLLENTKSLCAKDDSTMDLSMKLEYHSTMQQDLEQPNYVNAGSLADKEETINLSATASHESLAQCKRQTCLLETAKASNQPHRQTIHCNESFELEEQIPQTQQFNHALEVDSTNEDQILSNQPRRETIHCYEDLELEDTPTSHSTRAGRSLAQQISKTFDRQTRHFNHSLEVEDQILPHQRRRQTILCNEDLDLESTRTGSSLAQQIQALPQTKSRQTIHFNQDLEEEDNMQQSQASAFLSKPSQRKTLHFNQEIQIEEDTYQHKALNSISKATKRQTLYLNQDLEVEDHFNQNLEQNKPISAASSTTSKRQTIHFNENVEEEHINLESTQQVSSGSLQASPLLDNETKRNTQSNRGTVHFQQNNNTAETIQAAHDDSAMNISIADEPTLAYEQPKSVPKPRRLTIIDDHPADIDASPQKPFVCKSSFSRTLNFNEIPTLNSRSHTQSKLDMATPMQDQVTSKTNRQTTFAADDDSPLYYYNTKTKGSETTSEIDRSLAEYLKAEAAATAFRNNSPDMSMDIVVEGEQSIEMDKSKRQTSHEPVNVFEESGMQPLLRRQTVHDSNFTNENAVDESFFDENLSKPALTQNRKTLVFNDPKDPISDMDVTVSANKGKSAAIQSLKEILQESNMLFSQSKIVKPSTLNRNRSTIYFPAKDNTMDLTSGNESMECESPKNPAECTPTKSKLSKSRIPQLIDSAKKLQSMKKSMAFIQQELPNLGYTMHPEEEESFRGKSAGTPKTMQQSFDTVEIPRRVTAHKPRKLEESFDTIDIPRRATTFQKNDTLYLGHNEVDTTNVSQKSLYKFEDAPITISDVSTFFAQKLIPTCGETNETFSPNTTEALCNLDVNKFVKDEQMPRSSDSEDTAYNFDKFKKRYVELTCDSIVMSNLMEDIDKTHLSLVNTLDEQSEVVNSVCPQPPDIDESKPAMVEATNPPDPPLKPISSVCRKCKRHRHSVTQNETTIGSFVLDPLPEYKMDLGKLQELATKPKLSDVSKVWQQKLRESDSFNFSDGSRSMLSNDSMEDFIAALDNDRLMASRQRQRKEIKREVSFVHRLQEQMQSNKSNWILNETLLAGGVLRFTHTRIRTFAISIRFISKDPRGIEVDFNEIQLIKNVLHTRQWTPFEYALHYQLFVELPFDLRTLCPTSENLFQLLEHVENVTQDVLKLGKDMLYLVLTSPASLIRESCGTLYIRKYARTKTPQNEVKRTEFQIEVRNIKKLSYESIAVPPLYEFDEKIQLLPVGQDFLRVFLADPMRYIKSRQSNSFI